MQHVSFRSPYLLALCLHTFHRTWPAGLPPQQLHFANADSHVDKVEQPLSDTVRHLPPPCIGAEYVGHPKTDPTTQMSQIFSVL